MVKSTVSVSLLEFLDQSRAVVRRGGKISSTGSALTNAGGGEDGPDRWERRRWKLGSEGGKGGIGLLRLLNARGCRGGECDI